MNLTSLMIGISSVVFIGILLVIYSYFLKEKKNIILLWFSVLLSYLISYFLKLLFKIPRPVGLIVETGYSFPSSHAAVIFSTLVVMNFRFKNYKWLFILIAVLISYSRLYLGVHYLGDLIAGGLLGYFIGFLIYKKWK